MYKLSIKVSTLAELNQVVERLGSLATGSSVAVATPAAPKKKGKAAAAKPGVPEPVLPETGNFNPGVATPAAPAAPAFGQPFAQQTAPAAPAFDRAGTLRRIENLMGKAAQTWPDENTQGQVAQAVVQAAGIPQGLKIADFSDEQMTAFLTAFINTLAPYNITE